MDYTMTHNRTQFFYPEIAEIVKEDNVLDEKIRDKLSPTPFFGHKPGYIHSSHDICTFFKKR